MKPIEIKGWTIYFSPLFYAQWQELVGKVKSLNGKLEPEKFVTHYLHHLCYSRTKILKKLNFRGL